MFCRHARPIGTAISGLRRKRKTADFSAVFEGTRRSYKPSLPASQLPVKWLAFGGIYVGFISVLASPERVENAKLSASNVTFAWFKAIAWVYVAITEHTYVFDRASYFWMKQSYLRLIALHSVRHPRVVDGAVCERSGRQLRRRRRDRRLAGKIEHRVVAVRSLVGTRPGIVPRAFVAPNETNPGTRSWIASSNKNICHWPAIWLETVERAGPATPAHGALPQLMLTGCLRFTAYSWTISFVPVRSDWRTGQRRTSWFRQSVERSALGPPQRRHRCSR